jgi:hypothetical protein
MTKYLSVTLALLVARVLLANDADDTLAADNLAGIANLFDAGSNLHDFLGRKTNSDILRDGASIAP